MNVVKCKVTGAPIHIPSQRDYTYCCMLTSQLNSIAGGGRRRSMESSSHVLLVEDDAEIRELLAAFLRRNGMRVSVASDGREMDQLLSVSAVDILILDVMLPDEDGLSVCRRVRAGGGMPIIMLTARGQEVDRIIG